MLSQVILDAPYLLLLFAGAGGVIAFLFKLLIASKDREFVTVMEREKKALLDMESMKKSYGEIAKEAVLSATATTNYLRAQEGKAPLLPIVPVVPESHSPATPAQEEAAMIATMRAQMELLKAAAGQPPRVNTPEGPVSPSPSEKKMEGGQAENPTLALPATFVLQKEEE